MSYRSDVAALEARRESLQHELRALGEPLRQEAAARLALREVEAALAARRALLPRLRAPQVRVACDEPWSGMRGGETSRRCDRCKKDVYNLSAMSDAEVAAFLAASGEACARFFVRDDETVVTADCTRGTGRTGLKVLAGSMLVGSALAFGALATKGHEPLFPTPVEELVARSPGPIAGPGSPSAKVGVLLRVRGKVAAGSLAMGQGDVWYTLVGENAPALGLRVHHAGVVPDGFAEAPTLGLPVVVEGILQANGTFEASFVIAPRLRQGYVMRDHDAGP